MKITRSYEKPITRQEIKKMTVKILFRSQKTKVITNMHLWFDINNFGNEADNKWLRAIKDTLFKKTGSTWTPINTDKSLDELTDLVMNYWKTKLKNE
jgi:hypothetical protein